METELINEGFLSKFPILAGLGLATVLGVSAGTNSQPAHNKKANVPVKVSTIKKSAADTPGHSTNSITGNAFDFISQWEGNRSKMYKDSSGNPTIGVGHHLTGTTNDISILTKIAPGKKYSDVVSGKVELSSGEVDKLFKFDVAQKEKLVKQKIPSYDSLNADTKNALLNSFFRGDIGPNTIKLINKGRWKEASEEYLNHDNYTKGNSDQIKRRMKTNAVIFSKNETQPQK